MTPFVSIIIVNYNGKHFLDECLSSVFRQSYTQREIIVVDNASTDGSIDYLKRVYPAVIVIENTVNLGFAGGNNLGTTRAAGSLIVLLNNDTVVHEGWLQGLVDAVQDDDVACASSLIRTQGIPDKYYERNGSINFLGHNIMRVFEEPTNIFFPGGASLVFKKELFNVPFENEYFAYAEDVYLGLRARFMGYQVRHTNASRLDHFGSGTSRNQRNTFLTFYQERNRLLNTFLFFSPFTILKTVPMITLNCIAKCTASLLGMKYSSIGLIKAYGWFFFNIPLILRKRTELQSEQQVNESEVIRYMTGKLTNGESAIGRIINYLVLRYCRIVRLNVIEIYR